MIKQKITDSILNTHLANTEADKIDIFLQLSVYYNFLVAISFILLIYRLQNIPVYL